MRSFYKSFQVIESYFTNTKSKIINYNSVGCNPRQVCLEPYAAIFGRGAAASFCQEPVNYSWKEFLTFHNGTPRGSSSYRFPAQELFKPYKIASALQIRCVTTTPNTKDPVAEDACSVIPDTAKRIKFKRPDKTARHIMQILDKEAVQTVKTEREIPDIKPGHIIQLKVEVPENKRRISTLKGIVIARRNAGLNTTFRLRRLVAGIGVESVFPLYSPNIKEFKILDKKEVRRAKLYYLRERMNPLRD